ncbi:MAG: zinc-dependent metalloprotease family protein [Bacteroidota bacterium]
MRYLLFALLIVFSTESYSQGELRTLNKELPCLDKKFQVYAHIFLDSLGVANYTPDDLRNELISVNDVFSPICLSFELCGVDTITNYEFDSTVTAQEEAEIKTLFHVKNRINFYIISEIWKGPTLKVCGFASVAGIANMNSGMVFMSGGCAAHELGHLFGLLHTFENPGSELVDGSNCETTGDLICDTPADPFVEGADTIWQGGIDGCEFIWEGLDPNGQYYQPDVGNIMSYYGCTCGFTRQQYLKMAETYLNSNFKMW